MSRDGWRLLRRFGKARGEGGPGYIELVWGTIR